MKMFEFTGLRTLHKDMMKKGEERATFPFGFNGKTFSCIFDGYNSIPLVFDNFRIISGGI